MIKILILEFSEFLLPCLKGTDPLQTLYFFTNTYLTIFINSYLSPLNLSYKLHRLNKMQIMMLY